MSNSVPVLTLSPAWNATEVYADTTSYTQLGDGYSVNSVASVHPNAVEWNISRVGLSKIEIDEIVSFLSALGGVAGFLWSPHESIGRRLFFCEKWNVDFLGENVYGFTATFTEDVRGECLAFAALIDTNEIISQLNQSSVFINNFTLSSGSYLVNSNNNLVVRSLHTHSEQIPSDSGTLYDQVILALACLNAYTTTNASVWLTRATNYANAIVTNYYNSDVNGTLYLPHWLYDVKTDNRKEDIYFTLRTLNTGEVNTPLGWLPMLWELYDRLYQITNDSQWQTLANRTKNDAITAATFSNQSYVYRKNLGSVTEYPGTQIIGTATRILDGELEGFVEVSGSSDLTVQNLANQTDLTSDTSYTVEASADTNDRIVEFFVSTSTDDSNESQIYRHFVLLDDVNPKYNHNVLLSGILFTAGTINSNALGHNITLEGINFNSDLTSISYYGIFGYGYTSTSVSITNIVSNGLVSADVAGVGTARYGLAAASYGTDKAIFGYGFASNHVSMTNLVSNTGVVSVDVAGVGTARNGLAAAGYGGDKAIFGYGSTGALVSLTNLVSNTGVVATDTAGVGTPRRYLAAAKYGGDKAIFGFGNSGSVSSITNLVSNTGVVSNDVAGVGKARYSLAAAGYGGDKAIFGFGYDSLDVSTTNLVSNTGIVATDTLGVGTSRFELAAIGYGDKAMFGYGLALSIGSVSIINLVSNTGVVATDTAGVGTPRYSLAATNYG